MRTRLVRSRYPRFRGFTLAEAAISTLVVSIMMAAALTSVARTGAFRRVANDQQMAHLLADQLMAEILSKSYWDPSSTTPTTIGPSTAERTAGKRSAFNDVDDYHGWVESPPKGPDGTNLVGPTGWYRLVQVTFVNYSNLSVAIASDNGLKRIYVEVGRVRSGGTATTATDRQPIATLVSIAGRGRGL